MWRVHSARNSNYSPVKCHRRALDLWPSSVICSPRPSLVRRQCRDETKSFVLATSYVFIGRGIPIGKNARDKSKLMGHKSNVAFNAAGSKFKLAGFHGSDRGNRESGAVRSRLLFSKEVQMLRSVFVLTDSLICH